jgi:TRAP-type C4-dicarboxylate transport system substrate-binding protein
VRYGFADREFVGLYVPMISESFYKKLPPDLQALVIDLWRENIKTYRKSMEDAQTEARHTLEKNGIVFVSPSESALAEVRSKMMPSQESIAKELRISPALLQQVQSDVNTAGH